jgi:hypothetical protein
MLVLVLFARGMAMTFILAKRIFGTFLFVRDAVKQALINKCLEGPV